MKGCHLLEEYLEGDILGKIYNNNFNLAEQQPITKEYIRVMKLVKRQEEKLLPIDGFKKYLEIRNMKDAIEAEEQFKLGFKTAFKIIIEGCYF